MKVGLQLDLRNPPQWHKPWREFYAAAIDWVVEAERLGVDYIRIPEHHMWDDGYIPQPLTFLAAVAARTSRIRLMTGIIILPLHDPRVIAEQAAVIDCISGGRVELGFGVGNRIPEYEFYGVDFKKRFSIYDQKITELRRAWERVTPRALQTEIPLWAGLRGPRGSRIAGKHGMGRLYMAPLEFDDGWNDYLAGLDEGGHGRDKAISIMQLQGMLADDPEKVFAETAPYIENHWNRYRHYGTEGTGKPALPPLKAEEFRKVGAKIGGRLAFGWEVMTPETAARYTHEMAGGRAVHSVHFPFTASGQLNDTTHRHMELAATKFKAAFA